MPILNSQKYPREWAYFKKWARRFPDEVPERRYGIPKMEARREADMLYESDPGLLFQKFITEGTIGAQVHDFVIDLEIMEGKKHRSVKNSRRY